MKMPKRPRTNIDPPLTSFGDIAFQLIIFFVLTTVIMDDAQLQAQLPKGEELEQLPSSARISIGIDEESAIWYNGKKMDMGSWMDALPPKLEADLALIENPKDRVVIFRCDQNINKKLFEPVLGFITSAGGVVVLVGEEGQPDIVYNM